MRCCAAEMPCFQANAEGLSKDRHSRAYGAIWAAWHDMLSDAELLIYWENVQEHVMACCLQPLKYTDLLAQSCAAIPLHHFPSHLLYMQVAWLSFVANPAETVRWLIL